VFFLPLFSPLSFGFAQGALTVASVSVAFLHIYNNNNNNTYALQRMFLLLLFLLLLL